MNNNQNNFNLVQRTTDYSIKFIRFIKTLKITIINKPIIDQVIRSVTSIGANYHEASEADSKKDFQNKIRICKKEAKETMYWLKLLVEIEKEKIVEIRELYREAHEFVLIFSACLKH
jgi:four helix bundle protein